MTQIPQRIAVLCVCVFSIPTIIIFGSKIASNYTGCAPVGTYQIRIEKNIASPFSVSFMDSLRLVIQSKREKEKDVILKISPETTVRILPEAVISTRTFRPLDEFVFVDRKVMREKTIR